MLSRILIAGCLVVALTAVAGCSQTTEPETQAGAQAPELPPVGSMALDLSFFTESESAAELTESAASGITEVAASKLNFYHAVLRAAFVNLVVVDVLTPPTLAFSAAIHTFPSYQEDGSYLWIYTWVDDGQDHQIRLRGEPVGDYVDWELRVVLPGAEAELWFAGRSHQTRDEGYWVFTDFSMPGDPEVLRIDWQRASEHDAFLTFTNVHAGDPEEGDVLEYREDGDMCSITFYENATGEDWDIVWDESDGSGSLRVPDYNNGERACWDSNQENVTCPAAAPAILSLN